MLKHIVFNAVILFCIFATKTISFCQGDWRWPISNSSSNAADIVTSIFGPRDVSSSSYVYDFHRGIDIRATSPKPVHSITDGTVVRIFNRNGTQNQTKAVVIKHTIPQQGAPDVDIYSAYLHLSQIYTEIVIGYNVSIGEAIGLSGNTGTSFEHLHFSLLEGEEVEDEIETPLIEDMLDYAFHPLWLLNYDEFIFPDVELDRGNTLDGLSDLTLKQRADALAIDVVEHCNDLDCIFAFDLERF